MATQDNDPPTIEDLAAGQRQLTELLTSFIEEQRKVNADTASFIEEQREVNTNTARFIEGTARGSTLILPNASALLATTLA